MTLEDLKDRSEFGRYLTDNNFSGTGVEVGVFRGEFSNQILSTWPGILIGVDCYNNGTEFNILWDAIRNNIEYVGDCRYRILVCMSHIGAGYVKSELDFVFIDAGHTFPEVAQDIQVWWPKIKHGGILCGHDYDEREPGVKTAVDEFLVAHMNLKMHHKPCGSWFIQKQ